MQSIRKALGGVVERFSDWFLSGGVGGTYRARSNFAARFVIVYERLLTCCRSMSTSFLSLSLSECERWAGEGGRDVEGDEGEGEAGGE